MEWFKLFANSTYSSEASIDLFRGAQDANVREDELVLLVRRTVAFTLSTHVQVFLFSQTLALVTHRGAEVFV